MEIIDGVEIVDVGLYIRKHNVLIISDPHIGYDESLNKQGVLVPRTHGKDIIEILNEIIKKVKKIEKVIINGDIKHEFGKISEMEWRNTLRLIDSLSKNSNEVILIKGNHDTILGPIAEKRNIKIKEYEKIDDILIIHGDDLPEKFMLKGVKSIIIGHEHPAITIRDVSRAEKYKCFLKGTWNRKKLVVMPSINPFVYGGDVVSEKRFSPLMPENLGKFEVFVIGDRVYYFGKISQILKD